MSGCTIAANADVSGIGIRINLYTTVLLMAVIPDIPERTGPLVRVLAENAGISGLALLITALLETHQGSLSLYHAIYIIHILYFTGIMVAPAGHYKHDTVKKRTIVSGLITYSCYLIFTVYALYVWGKGTQFWDASSFTCPDPSNEDIKEINGKIQYILFFRPILVSATWLRVVWMVGLGVSLALLVFFPVFGCICFLKQGVITQGWPTQPKNSLFFGAFWIGKILAVIYGVATLELYEKANWSSGVLQVENDWTFGQVFALVQLVTTLNEAVHCLISIYSGHSDAGSNGEDRESVASTHGGHSFASSRIARFGFGQHTGENGSHEPAADEGETINLYPVKSPAPAVQPLCHRETRGAMVIV